MTGGEDSKINTWVINPITLDDDESDGAGLKSGEEHDVDMGSPIQKKRDLGRGHDRVGSPFFVSAV